MRPENPTPQKNNPLHGVKLADMLSKMIAVYGWDYLASCIDVKCFKINPSMNSSLKFLRKTPWAREKFENLYLQYINNESYE